MSETITVQDYERAERALALEWARRGFTVHEATYAIANICLILINLLVVPDYIWFYFPLLFWGLGLLMHYVFGLRQAGRVIAERQAQIERHAWQFG